MSIFPNLWPVGRPSVLPNSHGWLAEGTAALLTKHLGPETKLVLELGAWLGKSTRHILKHARNAKVISVDLWDEKMMRGWITSRHPRLLPVLEAGVIDTYLTNQWDWRDRLTPVQMHSHDAVAALVAAGVSPDVVFLDTSHGYDATLGEVACITKAFPDAQIVGDDWLWKSSRSQGRVGKDWGCPVQRAVLSFLEGKRNHKWWVESQDTGWALTQAEGLLVAKGPTKEGLLYLHPATRIGGVVHGSGTYYEHDLLMAIHKRRRKGVYFDVGAHIGNHAMFFALECPATRVIAIEPSAMVFERLEITAAANQGAPTTLVQAAAHCSWKTARAGRRGRSYEGGDVPVVRLDDLIEDGERVVVIKVDVEGAEVPVLQSGSSVIRRHRPLIAAEASSDKALAALAALLTPWGYKQGARYSRKVVMWEPPA